jgi:hypothetical protein
MDTELPGITQLRPEYSILCGKVTPPILLVWTQVTFWRLKTGVQVSDQQVLLVLQLF